MQTITNHSENNRFPSSQIESIPSPGHGPGRGRGLASLADVLPADAGARADWLQHRPMTRAELVAAWYRGESDALGLVAAAETEQTSEDVRLVENCVRLLANRITDNGGMVTATMREEATAAGLLAIVQWRNGVLACPAVPGVRVSDAAAIVAWRAISDELSRDDKGHTVSLSTVSDDWLAAAVDPLAVACVAGIETRDDKAARWVRERGASRRLASLPSKMDNHRRGHARRVELVDRIETAAARLIQGDTLEAAAMAVGFKARAKARQTAGVQLARAARAVGLPFHLEQPSGHTLAADKFNPHRRPLAVTGRSFTADELWGAGIGAEILANGCVEWV